jgi:hypothetical protein
MTFKVVRRRDTIPDSTGGWILCKTLQIWKLGCHSRLEILRFLKIRPPLGLLDLDHEARPFEPTRPSQRAFHPTHVGQR